MRPLTVPRLSRPLGVVKPVPALDIPYYAVAGNGDNNTRRLHVLKGGANAYDPSESAGPYTHVRVVVTHSANFDVWAVDGSILQLDGNLYLLFSGVPSMNPWRQGMYIYATLSWEILEAPVQESPAAIDRRYHSRILSFLSAAWINLRFVQIIYSASPCSTDDYALGMLTLAPGANPMLASSWTKSRKASWPLWLSAPLVLHLPSPFPLSAIMTQFDSDNGSISSTAESETPTLSEEEWQRERANLGKKFEKYYRAKEQEEKAKVKKLEHELWQDMHSLAASHSDPAVRTEWKKKAEDFRRAAEAGEESMVMDIAKGLGLIVAAPFLLAGTVLYGVGLLTKGLGNLFTGGRIGAAMK
ncbi:hypothetical protein B0H19DRAFT_1366589 [Mycena capillaripes]|nr:hypothetical protein B0H19DRAFT_1366589 [Mycena capillaripes]